MPRPQQSFPGLDRVADAATRDVFRTAFDRIHALEGRGASTTALRAPMNLGDHRAINVADPEDDQDAVTLAYADAHYGADIVRRALQVGGSHPLNITQLLGIPAQSAAWNYVGTHAARLALQAVLQHVGVTFWETDRLALYQVQLVASVQTWVHILSHGMSGTLSPDLKPADLGVNDNGFMFWASDFDRVYRWSGSAWADAPGSERRGQVCYYDDGMVPPVGWALCDGSSVTRTTATGGTTSYAVPDLAPSNKFIRSVSGTTGGTGGSATTHTHAVDPPSTTSGNPSAEQEVQSGTGVNVANRLHTHAVDVASFTSGAPSGSGGDDALPPYYDLRPYVRL